MLQTALGRLRLIGLIEGTSFLLLLTIAMPLKYLAGRPEAVKYIGWAHGVLFMLYLLALMHAASERDWPLRRLFLGFVAAVVPLGPFVFDASLRREQAAAPPA